MTNNINQISPLDEQGLVDYLKTRVCGRAAGLYEDICLSNFPHDKYFIGSLRPAPPEEEVATRFSAELLNKMAPLSFGAEILVGTSAFQFNLHLQLRWHCYYRIFPSLEEQRLHARLDPRPIANPTQNITEEDRENSDDGENEAVVPDSSPTHLPADDSLFTKFRKIQCSVEGVVKITRAPSGASWNSDLSAFNAHVQQEFSRVREHILSDIERLRISELDQRIQVPTNALTNQASYEAFKRGFNQELLPDWQWTIATNCRSTGDANKIVVAIECTNSSPIDPRSWCLEGYFFNVQTVFHTSDAVILPFEIEMAAKGFRYDRHMWGRGFNCGIRRIQSGERYYFQTTNTPTFEQMRFTTNNEPAAEFRALAANPIKVLNEILNSMKIYLKQWREMRNEYIHTDSNWLKQHSEAYDSDMRIYESEIDRFEKGIKIIEADKDIELAFRLMNETFSSDTRKTSWRLFQIVFIVTQIPGFYALKEQSEEHTNELNTVDIVYFPTGGGKTEAYLGVVIFHCFFDRLRGKTAGVTAWTRFPLRLLTLQQTQRFADAIGNAELIRRRHNDQRLSGPEIDGFAVGYFAGMEATPNELVQPDNGFDLNWSVANDPSARQKWKKIVKCPSCRTNSIIIDFEAQRRKLIHRCTNDSCAFPQGILPVFVVDNEIYRYLPSVIVGTLDKLASVAFQVKFALIFGLGKRQCRDHGYCLSQCCQKDCKDPKKIRSFRPSGISGPTLFVQDELHLLKEGLGTFDGHYETFVQALMRQMGQSTPVKIIASSATIEAFGRQVSHLYGRQARVFPGLGPTHHESFYAKTLEYPQRIFVGILPHNKTIFNAMLELLQYFHEEVEILQRLSVGAQSPFQSNIRPGESAWIKLLDLYSTSLTYFNATRELSSLRTDLEWHVNIELEKTRFTPLRFAELSGSTSTNNVGDILDQLENPTPQSPNAILATSMISHGVDIDRLNCMFFYGMPKQTAEYIQSSSRVGRTHIGLVFDCFKPVRERDQSHFLYFTKYHSFLGQLVEPVAINRWSKFSIQRTISGLFMAVLIQIIANRQQADKATRFTNIEFVKRQISSGAIQDDLLISILEEAYRTHEAPPGSTFKIEVERNVHHFLDLILGYSGASSWVSDALIPPPMKSLRDVDEPIKIILDQNGNLWANSVRP